jgi:ribonuclease HI
MARTLLDVLDDPQPESGAQEAPQAGAQVLAAEPGTATIYCDGACSGNPGAGGWGTIVESGGQKRELSGGAARTTNNQMEMQALIEGLKAVPGGTTVKVVTDSEYVVKGATQWMRGWIRNGWKTASKQPVKNKELWQEINGLLINRPHTFQWVRGHAGHEENERCDELARGAIATMRARG